MSSLYKSKVGLELVIPICIVFGGVILLAVINQPNWTVIMILAPIILFIVHLFLSTYYVIDQNELRIKSSFFYKLNIQISRIDKISETSNPISSPATSLDRLEIRYDHKRTVIISPKRKQAFIEELLKLNPAIEVRLKK